MSQRSRARAAAGLRADPDRGLTPAQVAERVAAGQVNDQGQQPTRTVGQILRPTSLTRFNAILGGLFVVIAIVGPLQDGLFGLVLVANSGIGIVQELRAKRTLDRLTVLNAPTATVLRDGAMRRDPGRAGGPRRRARAAARRPGRRRRRGADLRRPGDRRVAAERRGRPGQQASQARGSCPAASWSPDPAGSRRPRWGRPPIAARLAGQARSYSPARSEIRDAINLLLKWISWLLVPVGVLLVVRQLQSGQSVAEALRGSVAGLVGMVPEGLVLLTSVAMAVGVVRLAARRVLVQDLPAIEGLARVDVVCCDKTGTLTQGSMHVVSVIGVGTRRIRARIRAQQR